MAHIPLRVAGPTPTSTRDLFQNINGLPCSNMAKGSIRQTFMYMMLHRDLIFIHSLELSNDCQMTEQVSLLPLRDKETEAQRVGNLTNKAQVLISMIAISP